MSSRYVFGYIQLLSGTASLLAASVKTFQYDIYIKQIQRQILMVMGLMKARISLWSPVPTYASVTTRSKTTWYLKATNAVAAVNTYLNCTTITGVQLENDNSDPQTIELERTVFMGELMSSGAVSEYAAFSTITAGLLLDTGWYGINSAMLQTYYFGYQRGCQFYTQTTYTANDPEYCNSTGSATKCSYMLEAYGYCVLDANLDAGFLVWTP